MEVFSWVREADAFLHSTKFDKTSKPVVIFARTSHQTADCFDKHRYYLPSKTKYVF